jgi:hypothetical protein
VVLGQERVARRLREALGEWKQAKADSC